MCVLTLVVSLYRSFVMALLLRRRSWKCIIKYEWAVAWIGSLPFLSSSRAKLVPSERCLWKINLLTEQSRTETLELGWTHIWTLAKNTAQQEVSLNSGKWCFAGTTLSLVVLRRAICYNLCDKFEDECYLRYVFEKQLIYKWKQSAKPSET